MDQHKQLVSFDYGGMALQRKSPQVYGSAWVAPTATLTGRVEVVYFLIDLFACEFLTLSHTLQVGHETSIWYGVVIKGDVTNVRIGSWTNIQDDTVVQEALKEVAPDNNGSVVIGNYVTVSSRTHSCVQLC